MTFSTRAILEFWPAILLKWRGRRIFFFLQQKHVFRVALARMNKSKCLKKIITITKKKKMWSVFFFWSGTQPVLFKGGLCSHLSLEVLLCRSAECSELSCVACYLRWKIWGLQIYLEAEKKIQKRVCIWVSSSFPIKRSVTMFLQICLQKASQPVLCRPSFKLPRVCVNAATITSMRLMPFFRWITRGCCRCCGKDPYGFKRPHANDD